MGLDTLREELKHQEGPERIHTLNSLAKKLAQNQQEKALSYAREADSLANVYDNMKEQAEANRTFGDIYFFKRDYATAHDFYMRALKLDEQAGNQQSYVHGVKTAFTSDPVHLNAPPP